MSDVKVFSKLELIKPDGHSSTVTAEAAMAEDTGKGRQSLEEQNMMTGRVSRKIFHELNINSDEIICSLYVPIISS